MTLSKVWQLVLVFLAGGVVGFWLAATYSDLLLTAPPKPAAPASQPITASGTCYYIYHPSGTVGDEGWGGNEPCSTPNSAYGICSETGADDNVCTAAPPCPIISAETNCNIAWLWAVVGSQQRAIHELATQELQNAHKTRKTK